MKKNWDLKKLENIDFGKFEAIDNFNVERYVS